MDLAISLPLPGVPLRDLPEVVRRGRDEWGYGAAWASEVAGPDFTSVLGAVAARVDGVDLGVAVAPMQTRSPWLLAASAASLSHLSGGRFTLGVGTSSEVIVEQWSGLPFERPLSQLRETVEVLRAILAGDKVAHDGAFVRTHGYRLFDAPPAEVPIAVGALNPKSLRQAGEIGDGVCLNQFGPDHLPAMLDEVRAGAESAGKSLDGFPVIARLFCWVTDDVAAAREIARKRFTPYVATTVYNRFYRWLGFEEEAAGVQEALARGARDAAVAAMSDRLIDSVLAIGDAEAVAERVQAYGDAGLTVAAIAPLDPGDAMTTLEAIGARLG
jgi:probable F420-dependent oxidoreductase